MRDLPAGTVTFLFTDIEGSTRLLTEHGPAFADLLAEHRRALRQAFAEHGGVEVDTQGDAFFVAFARASDAVAAASEAQGALAEGPVRVRIGIHTGEPLVTDEGYVGMDVHRAARIAAAAHGGQVVLSESTRVLLDQPDGLRDLGDHRLKDLIRAEHLYQVGEGEFPPLRSLGRTNMPVQPTPLVGREEELAEICGLVRSHRLVTLTGPGGSGKTRLALQVAADLADEFADGAFLVRLEAIEDPALVPSEIERTLGLSAAAGQSLEAYLAGRRMLLLLDNLEQVLDAAPAIADLMRGADGIRVLATSRAPLRLAGERVRSVAPLEAEDAATLFLERAQAADPSFVLDSDAADAVEEICARLDGLPLAIELAAARSALLAPPAMLERLNELADLDGSARRDAPERQRTVRRTIDWSYQLLAPDERTLFECLGAFVGGFTVQDVDAVAGRPTLGALGALLDGSLVRRDGERFRMLETIREYAAARLDDSGHGDEVRRRHAEVFRSVAEDAYRHRIDDEARRAARLEADHDNLRAALDWLADHDPDAELAVAGSLGWFWQSRSHLAEGVLRLGGALARSGADGPPRARALTAVGTLMAWQGDVDDGVAHLRRGLDAWHELDDPSELASALDSLGWVLVYAAGDDRGALDAFERSLEIRRSLGDRAGETRALVGVCQVLVAMGEVARAEALSLDLLELARGKDRRAEHFALHFLADCSLIAGDFGAAKPRYRDSLRAAIDLGDVFETSIEVQGVAMAVAGEGDPALAVRLAGAVAALWESLGVAISVRFWDELIALHVGGARDRLGDAGDAGDAADAADAAEAEGRATAFDAAVRLALGES